MEKVLERKIFKHVFKSLERHELFLHLINLGFLPGVSTVNKLTNIYEKIRRALDKG